MKLYPRLVRFYRLFRRRRRRLWCKRRNRRLLLVAHELSIRIDAETGEHRPLQCIAEVLKGSRRRFVASPLPPAQCQAPRRRGDHQDDQRKSATSGGCHTKTLPSGGACASLPGALPSSGCAGVMELADMPALGAGARKSVGVRVPPPALVALLPHVVRGDEKGRCRRADARYRTGLPLWVVTEVGELWNTFLRRLFSAELQHLPGPGNRQVDAGGQNDHRDARRE